MTIKTKDNSFNYSNIVCTADMEKIDAQYRFILNRLLLDLNILLLKNSAFLDVYYADYCPVSNTPTLHFVVEGHISNQALNAYLEYWPAEFSKLRK